MQFAAKTDIGKLRDRNEDLYYFDKRLQLFAIADGMSGHERGDLASKLTIDVIQEWAQTQTSLHNNLHYTKRLAILRNFAEKANQRLYTTSKKGGKTRGMGTTLIACFVTFSYLTYVHVGDSRLYVLRAGKLIQITIDDSLVQKMIEQNKITLEEGRVHEKRNIITQAIGLRETINVKADVYPLVHGDIVFACTDGLYDSIVDDQEIVDIITSAVNLKEACNNLVNAALDYGGTDNITVLLSRID